MSGQLGRDASDRGVCQTSARTDVTLEGPVGDNGCIMSAPFDLALLSAGLVFAEALPDLDAALAGGLCVVQAPPGTGKTTLTPPAVANFVHAQGRSGRVIVTQPRRIAVRAAARRLAELSNTRIGELAGYSVRGDTKVSRDTRVEFVTPGVLIRRLLADPELDGVAAVILDEVHERSLDVDLLVGMLADVQELRDDLTFVVMSATLDAGAFANLLGDDSAAPVVDCPSALHPLDIQWHPSPSPRMDSRGVTHEFLNHVAASAASAMDAADATSDALVFLPGVREVSIVTEYLQKHTEFDILQLHGRADAGVADRVIAGRNATEPRRIVVSTAVAESSITVPGVRIVIDAGLAREPRRDEGRNMSGLVTVAESQASAQQRAGRAARLGPGMAVRCFDAQTYARMPAHRSPEITAADLTDAALILAAWGTPEGKGLRLPTPPPAAAIRHATERLEALGALEDGRLTPLGEQLSHLPLDPALGAGLLSGARGVGARDAAEVIAALADDFRADDAALPAVLTRLRTRREAGAQRWAAQAERLEHLAIRSPHANLTAGRSTENPEIATEFVTGFVVASAYPERVARRVGGADSRVYLLASGSRAALPQGSRLHQHEWLAVAEVARLDGPASADTGAVIRMAAELDEATARRAAARLDVTQVRGAFDQGKVTARRVHELGAIELSSTPVKATSQEAAQIVRQALVDDGLGVLHWDETADALRRRLAFAHRRLGEPWPDVSDAALLERIEEWLAPELGEIAGGRRPKDIKLTQPLQRLLPWPEATRFDELVPERLEVPSGSRIRLEYPPIDDNSAPVAAVKLQETFGLATSPTVADGRVRVLFHLLSPARRPLAITDDLASFWDGPYAAVRAEMRGRYPKHPWPEDPWNHIATAKTTKRLGT